MLIAFFIMSFLMSTKCFRKLKTFRKVRGEVMVVSEESGVREEFGSTDTDEYKID